jgi:hypothetical protein
VLNKEKALLPPGREQGFFFVAECDQISDFMIISDILQVIEFMDSNP